MKTSQKDQKLIKLGAFTPAPELKPYVLKAR